MYGKGNSCILLLLLLSHFSCVWLCATPQTEAHQAPPSLGFSRQKHWSRLPFPSPMQEKWKVKVKSLSHAWLVATPWTISHQAPPSMGFSGQEYWSGLPLPSPCILLVGMYICTLWMIVERFLRKLKIEPQHDPATLFLDIYPKEWKLSYLRNSCSPLLIVVHSRWPRYTI